MKHVSMQKDKDVESFQSVLSTLYATVWVFPCVYTIHKSQMDLGLKHKNGNYKTPRRKYDGKGLPDMVPANGCMAKTLKQSIKTEKDK